MTDVRLGEHTGAVQNALGNTTPADASRSMFGVRASRSPWHPKRGEQSSNEIHRKWGRFMKRDLEIFGTGGAGNPPPL